MIDQKRVLIVDDMHESILELLKHDGCDPVYLPVLKREGILEVIKDFYGLFIRSKTKVDQELIDRAPNLKFVARAGAGIDKLDQQYLESKGIRIVNAPEGNRDSLAEHALGMLLAVLHRIPISFDQIREGIWDREGNRGIELNGKTVGIYGVGYMGRSFAKKLAGLGCEIIGYDKYDQSFPRDIVTPVSLAELQERTEILSIHIPLTGETKGLFDKAYLEIFKSLKILVNTSRGKVLETAGLLDLLETGKLYGAALDVLENEKPETYSQDEKEMYQRLMAHQNVVVTPHVGGWSFESYKRINKVLVDKLRISFTS